MKLKELLESMRTYPSLSEVLDEICNEVQLKQDTISSLKKRIKYCKNPIEKKNLERELTNLYKKRKRKSERIKGELNSVNSQSKSKRIY